jgi:hypothetical protein
VRPSSGAIEASADWVTWDLVQSVSSENGRISIDVPMGDAVLPREVSFPLIQPMTYGWRIVIARNA